MPIVIVISTPATIPGVGVTDGIAPDLGRFAYPGWGWPSGLGRHEIPGGYAENNATNVRLMLKNPGTYNMVCAGYVARISGRPFVFELQRVLQLVQTVQAMLKDPTGAWRPPGWQAQDMDQPVMIEGGSFGGWVAQWAVLLFPEHFHGAFASASGEGMRLSWQQQELWRYGATLSGFTASGRDYGLMDTLQVSAGMWQYRNYRVGTGNPAPWATWSPFFHTSITREWRDGRLYWPVYYVLSDEDVTADGTDFLPLFDGIPAYHDHGWIPGPPAIYWSVKDKATHSGGLHTTAIGNQLTWEHHDDQLEFLPQVINSYWNYVNTPPTPHPLPTYQPPGVVNQTMDPYEHVYSAPPVVNVPSTPLHLDQTYPGAGTTLGGGDSLQVANGFVYVGSAEGVVTRFQVNINNLEMETKATSARLGYGAWALAVGDVNGSPGDEVVVGTYRRLYVLDGMTLATLASVDLPWEQSRPHHLQLADVVIHGGNEILFASELGDLAVYQLSGGQLQQLARYGEPGIVDFLVLSTYQKPIVDLAILSERGHVVNVKWNTSIAVNGVKVTAVSERLNGQRRDLELANIGGVRRIVALLSGGEPNKAIRVFNQADLSQLNIQFSMLVSAGSDRGVDYDIEAFDNDGTTYLLAMAGGALSLFDTSAGAGTIAPLGIANLASWTGTIRPLDIAVGDLDPVLGGIPQEVAVSTSSGSVAWIPVDWLQVISQTLNLSTNARQGGLSRSCNRTTAATWAMTSDTTPGSPPKSKLYVADQAGGLWRLDGQGNQTFLYDMRNVYPDLLEHIVTGPIRDLVKVGQSPLTTSYGNNSLVLDTFAGATALAEMPSGVTVQRVSTYPYVGSTAGPIMPIPTNPSVGIGTWWNNYPHSLFLYPDAVSTPPPPPPNRRSSRCSLKAATGASPRIQQFLPLTGSCTGGEVMRTMTTPCRGTWCRAST